MPLKKDLQKLLAEQKRYHQSAKYLLAIIFILIIFGLVYLSSATSVVAYTKMKDAYYYFKHQLFGLGIGLAAFWFFSKVDYHIWRKYAFGFLVFSIVLLLLVFIPGIGDSYGKARSWINFFGYSLQPSELVKLSLLLYFAAWLESKKEDLHKTGKGTGTFVFVMSIVGILMLMQPDLGTLSIIGFTSLIVFFVGGGKKKHIATFILAGIVGLAILVAFKTSNSAGTPVNTAKGNYIVDRFSCALNIEAQVEAGKCYQVNQSLIAVGSGGIFGLGIGNSRQKFGYLPEVSGDSIFAIIAEETGLVFSLLLVMLYLFLFYRSYEIAKKAPDNYGRNIAIGIGTWISIQAFINIAGIINLIPMTGVPLPFISYGGTAILAILTACGILINISRQTKAVAGSRL
jgi:cell division protein FtsW